MNTGTVATEGFWEVIEDTTSGAYVTIGNSFNADQISRLWISSYNSNGYVSSSVIVSNGRRMIARDISMAPKDSTGKPTYYVTGWTQSTSGTSIINQMFVGRIRLNGTFIWYTENPSPTIAAAKNKEGISVVSAPNGDAVVLGLAGVTTTTGVTSPQVFLARFSASGSVLWSNIYAQSGNWLPRSIANGAAPPNCAVSPGSLPGSFVITGEVTGVNTSNTKPVTFASVFNGAGIECWRGLYPASSTTTTFGDAGYDVILHPTTGNYNIVGVVQYSSTRNSSGSTPYLLEVSPSGSLLKGAIYFKNPNIAPMGLYPRSCTINRSSITSAPVLNFTGPNFELNKVFSGFVPAIGNTGTFYRYDGQATANTSPQMYFLSDGQSDGIIATKLAARPGFVISTNAVPGSFGNADAFLIKTDLALQTPSACKALTLTNSPLSSNGSTFVSTTATAESGWAPFQPTISSLQLMQLFCNDTCTVTASFTHLVNGNTVSFTGTGGGNGNQFYKWIFGDGTTSTLQNPTHTYPGPGSYSVCFLVYNVNATGDTCATESCKNITINSCDVNANFTYTVSCKYKVTFNNTSVGSGTLTYKWLFDDGTSSTIKNPSKIFTTCGRHSTRLITCNTLCCDTIDLVVNIPCCEVKSDFCLRDSGLYVRLIYSTSMNLPSTTYTVFLDGVQTTWSANTSKLLTPGLHNVCLKARRISCPGDTCCATCCKQIYVSTPCTLVSDFWHQIQTGTGNVIFTNKTTPAGYSSSWSFGDNSPVVTTTNPTHTYRPGTYVVCLTTTQPNGGDTCYSRICRKITIDSVCKPIAKFKTSACLNAPLTIEFSNFSTGAVNYIWNFGDGPNTSSAVNPTHTYNTAGTYNVCLYAYTGNDNCVSRICRKVIVKPAACKVTCDSILPGNRIAEQNAVDEDIANNTIVEEENDKAARTVEKKTHSDNLTLFPNPASQNIQVRLMMPSQSKAEVIVVSALGEIVYKQNVQLLQGTNQFTIPINKLAQGNYYLKIKSADISKSSLFTVSN